MNLNMRVKSGRKARRQLIVRAFVRQCELQRWETRGGVENRKRARGEHTEEAENESLHIKKDKEEGRFMVGALVRDVSSLLD